MNYILQIIQNEVVQTSVISWFVAQMLKVLIVLIIDKRLDFTRITGSGGMPSSHSSFTVSLACACGFVEGFDSVVFALSAAFALVVMYDAAGVRRAAGHQAAVLNQIIAKVGKEDIAVTGKKLKELLGHTPVEVLAGAILGVIISIIRFM